jgi:hypothetical protein
MSRRCSDIARTRQCNVGVERVIIVSTGYPKIFEGINAVARSVFDVPLLEPAAAKPVVNPARPPANKSNYQRGNNSEEPPISHLSPAV